MWWTLDDASQSHIREFVNLSPTQKLPLGRKVDLPGKWYGKRFLFITDTDMLNSRWCWRTAKPWSSEQAERIVNYSYTSLITLWLEICCNVCNCDNCDILWFFSRLLSKINNNFNLNLVIFVNCVLYGSWCFRYSLNKLLFPILYRRGFSLISQTALKDPEFYSFPRFSIPRLHSLRLRYCLFKIRQLAPKKTILRLISISAKFKCDSESIKCT